MRIAKRLGVAWALALAAIASPALATTWTQVSDYVPPSSVVPASAYPGAAQAGGWYDVHGGLWSTTAAGQIGTSVSVTGSANLDELSRPAAEKSVDGQLQIKFVQSVAAANITQLNAYFRWSNSGTAATGYIAQCTSNANTIGFFKNVAGTLTALGSTVSFTPTAGAAYVCRASAVQTNSTTTTLTMTLYASDGVTQLATATTTDTTAALQNLSGGMAIFENNTGGGSPAPNLISELTTYTDVTAAATGFSFSESQTIGPNGAPTTTLDLAANGILAAPTPITLSDGAGGAFTPSSPSLSGAANTLLTYTPATVGAHTLTATAPGLTAPASLSYTALVVPTTNSSATFNQGPIAAAPAPGALFATTGWMDNSGGAWTRAAPNGIASALMTYTGAAPWINATLLRPAAEMRVGGIQQEDATVEYYSNSSSAYAVCNYVPGANPQFYYAGIGISSGIPQLAIGKYYNSTLTTGLALGSPLPITTSTPYDIRLKCDRTSGSQTVISVALYTTGGAQIGTTVSYTGTDAGLQNVNSGLGYFANNPNPGYTLPVISITTGLTGVATSYSFWGPPAGATGAATTFGVSANGVPAGSTPLSFSDAGAGGSFRGLPRRRRQSRSFIRTFH